MWHSKFRVIFTVGFAKKIITVAVHKYTERNGRGNLKKVRQNFY